MEYKITCSKCGYRIDTLKEGYGTDCHGDDFCHKCWQAVDMVKHTPGPWTIKCTSCDDRLAGFAYIVQEMEDEYSRASEALEDAAMEAANARNEANTHLISAAPDLLAALEKLVKDAEDYAGDSGCVGCAGEMGEDEDGNETEVEHEPDCSILQAKAAMAKARGHNS